MTIQSAATKLSMIVETYSTNYVSDIESDVLTKCNMAANAIFN